MPKKLQIQITVCLSVKKISSVISPCRENKNVIIMIIARIGKQVSIKKGNT